MGGDGGGRRWRAFPPNVVFGIVAVTAAIGLTASSARFASPGASPLHAAAHAPRGAGGGGEGSAGTTTVPATSTTSPGVDGTGSGTHVPAGSAHTVRAHAPGRHAPGSGGGASPAGLGGIPGTGLGGWVNLLTSAQSLFAGTASTWSGVQARVSWVGAPADGPGGALELVSSGTGGMWLMSGAPHTGGLALATPGAVYDGGATVRAVGAGLVVQPVIGFYDLSGAYITSVWGQGVASAAGTWRALAPVTALAPPRTAFVALGLLVYSSAPGQGIYMEHPALLGAPAPASAAVIGPLHTAGSQIVQANGRPVVLRGAELYGLDSSASAPEVTGGTVAAAKAWGANVMRVALGEQLWNATSCAFNPSYVAAVDRAVGWITSAGMVAILELQDSIVALGCPAGGPHDMADVSGSVPFWGQVAARYASNPRVIFDLYNEPHDISDAVWLSGGLITDTSGATFAAAGMQQLYDTVRGTGAQNLVIVSGNNWANTVPATLVHGNNVVYGVHAYTCPNAAPPSCTTPDPTDPSLILGNWLGVSASTPVMVSEFGWPSNADGAYIANVIAYATGRRWSWNAFAFDTDAPFGMVTLDPATGVDEPTPSGMPVLAALGVAASSG